MEEKMLTTNYEWLGVTTNGREVLILSFSRLLVLLFSCLLVLSSPRFLVLLSSCPLVPLFMHFEFGFYFQFLQIIGIGE